MASDCTTCTLFAVDRSVPPPAAGYYFHAASGFYYDANTGLYFDSSDQQWKSHDPQTGQYLAVDSQQQAGGSAPEDTAGMSKLPCWYTTEPHV